MRSTGFGDGSWLKCWRYDVMGKNMKPVFEESSGNVFTDVGLEDAEELLVRARLGHAVRMILESRKLKQREICQLLEIKQPEVSNLMNGRYTLFSQERLFGFLNKLDRKVTVTIAPLVTGENPQEVIFA